MWGDREGLACLAIGFGPHYDTNGKYKHRNFVPGFHRWPDQAETLLDRAMEYAPTADVYVAPLLRSSFARTKDTALPGRCCGPTSTSSPRRSAGSTGC